MKPPEDVKPQTVAEGQPVTIDSWTTSAVHMIPEEQVREALSQFVAISELVELEHRANLKRIRRGEIVMLTIVALVAFVAVFAPFAALW